jgi:membrane fusion protein
MAKDYALDPASINVRQPFGASVAGFDIRHYNLFIILAIALTLLMLMIVGTTPYSRTVKATGLTVFPGGTAQVAAPQSAVVANIHVRQGDLVAAGAALVTLDLHKYGAVGAPLDERLSVLLKTQRDFFQSQIAIEADRARSAGDRFTTRKSELEEQIVILDQQIGLQEELIGLDNTAMRAVQELRQSGYVSDSEFRRRAENLLLAKQKLADLRRQRLSAHSDIGQAEATMAETERQSDQSIARLKTSMVDIDQQLAKVGAEGSFTLRAPIAGRVALISIQAGQQAEQSAPIVTLVPNDEPMEVELFVPSKAAGMLSDGQSARVDFDAFPYQDFGFVPGRVTAISAVGARQDTALVAGISGEKLFKVTIALDKQMVIGNGKQYRFAPDMRVAVQLILDRKSIFAWLYTGFRHFILEAASRAS